MGVTKPKTDDSNKTFRGLYCFCFEEQRLNPNEEVDMPVFFYIDPEFDDDPRMARCFCFEEQRLNPNEEVDMPVFFYIDPEFDDDPRMARVDTITLSYTFFEAKDGQKLPLPGYS
ncbi:UNVERIFIED_CONTAM: hypothetical protein FKN15_069378 [Acipenser sinensis]